MSKKFVPIITIVVLSLGIQAQDGKKCPEDPSEFKGKEDDCFDCLEGALSNLKLFTVEVNKMLDEKKLTTAEEAQSMKTRSDDLWNGVEGWQNICEPKAEPEGEAAAEPEGEAAAESEGEAAAESEGEAAAEPEGEAAAEPEGEAAAEPEGEAAAEPEGEAAAEPEGEVAAEPEGEAAAELEGEATAESEG